MQLANLECSCFKNITNLKTARPSTVFYIIENSFAYVPILVCIFHVGCP